MSRELHGKVVLITGAGQGIGAEVARRLVARGARVALVDRVPDGVEELAHELGGGAAAFVADVTDEDATTAAIAQAHRHFGRLDAAVANAGVIEPPAPVIRTASAQFRKVLDVNVVGVFNTARAALPFLEESGGYLLCVSSVAGLIPVPTIASYVASKHAVDGFARSLRLELSTSSVGVGVAYFGVIDTPMAGSAIAHVAEIWSALPGPIGVPAPVGQAGKAIVDGIASRATTVYAPRWVAGSLLATRASTGLFEVISRLHPAVRALVSKRAD